MSARSFSGLRRIPERGIVAGVCAGLAEFFGWNVKLLRVACVVAVVFGAGAIIVVYAILWYVMDPVESSPASAYAGGDGPGPSSPMRRPTMTEVQARFERLDQRLRSIEECVTDKEFELRRELKKLEA
ncbi:MAG: PspC domain-containing protein [Gammaproteobacteria bacterium]